MDCFVDCFEHWGYFGNYIVNYIVNYLGHSVHLNQVGLAVDNMVHFDKVVVVDVDMGIDN